VGRDDPGTEDPIVARHSEYRRDRAPDRCGTQVALPGIRADHLLDGAAPGRDAGVGSRGYRCGPQAGPHPARQGPQGPIGAAAGPDLPGAARLVVQASSSAVAVPQCLRLDGDHPPGLRPHGPRRGTGGDEEDAGRLRH